MGFAVAMLLLLGGVGDLDTPVVLDAPAYTVDNAAASPYRSEQDNEGSCKTLVERLCTVAHADMCQALQREHERRRISPDEEAQCRSLLDDRDKLDKLLRKIGSSNR